MTRLDSELKYFKENLNQWLMHYEGQFALVKDNKLIKTFTKEEEAYSEGINMFGNVPFLIKQIKTEEDVVQLPALMLGLIRANT